MHWTNRGAIMSKPMRKPAPRDPEPLGAGQLAEMFRRGDRVQVLVNGVRFEVSPELDAALRQACAAAEQPLPEEMTTTQAAEFLDVSRPFVIKLTRQQELPCRLVGKHRRIPTAALRAYREKMFHQARTACDEMAQPAQESGLYELEGPPPKAR
jgi:excisionase family DNA binding protein